ETRATAVVRGGDAKLATVRARAPVSLAVLLHDVRAIATAPLEADATLEAVPIRVLTSIFGALEIASGVVDGTVTIAGTLAKPTARGTAVARNVALGTGDGSPAIRSLLVDGRWDGATGWLAIDGSETSGGTLRISAKGSSIANLATTVD